MRTVANGSLTKAVWAFAIMVFLALPLSTAADANCSAASAKAQTLGKKVTSIVANSGISSSGRLKQFRTLFRQNADFPTMARFALGKYWRKLPKSQHAEYFRLVENLVVKVMFGQLESYAGQRYSITTSRCLPKGSKGREFYVEGALLNAGGKNITNVKFWFLKTGGALKIFDFQIAGIWLTQQKRAEFTSFLQTRRGDINSLMNDLRSRAGT